MKILQTLRRLEGETKVNQLDIDTEQLEDMQNALGDAFPKLVQVTLLSLNKNKDKLGIAIDNKDMQEAHMASHSLGTSAGNLGLKEIYKTARQIETIAYDQLDAKECDFQEILNLYALIKQNFDETKQFLKSLL